MIIDSHAHYSHKNFDNTYRYLSRENGEYAICEGNLGDIFRKMTENGIDAFIEPGITLESNYKLLELAKNNPNKIFPAVGVHPTRVFNARWKNRRQIAALAENSKVIAIGETGLDFHHKRKNQHRFMQYMWFIYQLNIAKKKQLPLILHIRNADKEAIRILKHYRGLEYGGVVHCFNGGYDTAMEYISLGFHLGIGGMLLKKGETAERMKEAIAKVDIKNILVETDSPHVHPSCKVLKRANNPSKIRNTSIILPEVISEIAKIKGMECDEVSRIVTENTIKLFGLSIDEQTNYSSY